MSLTCKKGRMAVTWKRLNLMKSREGLLTGDVPVSWHEFRHVYSNFTKRSGYTTKEPLTLTDSITKEWLWAIATVDRQAGLGKHLILSVDRRLSLKKSTELYSCFGDIGLKLFINRRSIFSQRICGIATQLARCMSYSGRLVEEICLNSFNQRGW